MRAGDMRHQVTIQQQSGGVWSTFAADLWAEAIPARGREYEALAVAQSEVSIRFRLRYLAGVTGEMRVVWDGKNYPIVGEPVNVGGRRRELELMCRSDDHG